MSQKAAKAHSATVKCALYCEAIRRLQKVKMKTVADNCPDYKSPIFSNASRCPVPVSSSSPQLNERRTHSLSQGFQDPTDLIALCFSPCFLGSKRQRCSSKWLFVHCFSRALPFLAAQFKAHPPSSRNKIFHIVDFLLRISSCLQAPLLSNSRSPDQGHCVLYPTFSFGSGGWPMPYIPSWESYL